MKTQTPQNEERKKGIIHNCIKDCDFKWLKVVIKKSDRGIICCNRCGAEFKETEWYEENK